MLLRQPILLLLTVAGICGCNRSPDPPTNPPSATAPTTLPTTASFSVAGRSITFASPRTKVERSGETSTLLLYSDKENDRGGFYFEIPVDPDAAADDVIEWEQVLPVQKSEDSLVGIVLDKTLLVPRTLKITVRPGAAGMSQVQLSGEFSPDEEGAGAVAVQSTFEAGLVK